jgi:hypothetical protein
VIPLHGSFAEELGSAYVQYSFRSQLVFLCGVRPAVNEIRQTDFLFLETRCGLGGCTFPRGRNRFRLCVNCASELALHSLTERARSPFHGEPTQFIT